MKIRLRSVVLAGFMLLSAAIAQAHSGHHQQKATVRTNTCSAPSPECAETVTPAADGEGRLWLAFANDKTLYVQERKTDGSFGKALVVNQKPETILNQGETRIRLAFGAPGNLYVVWVTPQQKQYSSNIRFSYSTDNGEHFSTPVTINQDHWETMHNFPVLAVNTKRQVFIAWLDMRSMAKAMAEGKSMAHDVTADIYYNWSNDGGAHFQKQDQLIKAAACLCCHMAMALNAEGLPYLFYRDVYPGSERDHSLVRFVSSAQWLPPKRISFDHWVLHGCPEEGPALLRAQGRLHFLWFDKGLVHYRYMQNGKLSVVKTVGKKGSKHVTLAAANGVLYRGWQRYADNAMEVWLQTSSDGGDHWSAVQRIAATSGTSDYPLLVSDGNQVWLSWLTHDEGYRLLPLQQMAERQGQ
jgi:hypothetical protein